MQMVAAPVALAQRGKVSKPAQIVGNPYSANGSMRVKHREYIGEVLGSTSVFSNTQYPINPGLLTTFPWLSQIAPDFEEYKFNSLSFVYEPEKPTTAAGYVMIAIDYDAADGSPATKQQLAASLGAVRCPIWSNVRELADSQQMNRRYNQYFVRTSALSSNLDIKTYDVGVLNVAVGNTADASAIGELWIEYDVSFFSPQLTPDVPSANNSAIIQGGGAITRAAPFGTTPAVTGGLSVTALNATMTFPFVGQYLVVYNFDGTVVTTTAITLTGSATTTPLVGQFSRNTAASGAGFFVAQITAPLQTVIFDMTACATTVTTLSVRVATYAYALA